MSGFQLFITLTSKVKQMWSPPTLKTPNSISSCPNSNLLISTNSLYYNFRSKHYILGAVYFLKRSELFLLILYKKINAFIMNSTVNVIMKSWMSHSLVAASRKSAYLRIVCVWTEISHGAVSERKNIFYVIAILYSHWLD